jgi:hypothetical protein
VTLLMGVTHAVDTYTASLVALGPRWVFLRLSDRDLAGKQRMARRAGQRLAHREKRAALAEQAASLVTAARTRLPAVTLSAALADAVVDGSVALAYGRAVVPRSGYGRRDVVGLPDIEEPPRVAQAFTLLARGLLAVGLDESTTVGIVLRSAVDSMPRARAKVLTALADARSTGEMLTAAKIARSPGLRGRPAGRATAGPPGLLRPGSGRRAAARLGHRAGAARRGLSGHRLDRR